ncbi:MAG: hypothetical protein KGJ55_03955 [Gammaproteobacteria bacterium]|nr:hypothetical protein [Gammaproteobacteria bacterium]
MKRKPPVNPDRRPKLPGGSRWRVAACSGKPQPDYARRGGRQRSVH